MAAADVVREIVDQPEAGVVAGLFVFGAGVAEADDEADGHGGAQKRAKGRIIGDCGALGDCGVRLVRYCK
ncbi:hypothetical protein GCM10011430_09130 [Oxalicibacterium solurbis]|uniref:Uncharacterized protein n=1 Tax=Oxalicibacterium solurbis TaxID=69280 RepID=A0A8J3AU78_9BURK|nr:hypothetical protein GCM10011430_09130 [Oxalicibacterium solurbis]